ncbi:MAG TPA: dephospho-CoA kinase [Nevskiales bacterium]|nr:dephospho-CoA kinase [Nevskiales bacterium]
MKLTVGLTGGIASGKSLVGEHFNRLGVGVVDADQVARDVVAPGQPGLAALVARFGADILEPDGTLARRRMRERVFADAGARAALEAILHPLIHAELARRRDALPGEYRLLMIPLLARTGMRALVDRVLVVDAPEEVQLERLIRRDGITRELAQRMLAAQDTRPQRLAIADDVLRNDGPAERLGDLVARLHAHYLGIARGTIAPARKLHLPAGPAN